jgi:hypothetical protein
VQVADPAFHDAPERRRERLDRRESLALIRSRRGHFRRRATPIGQSAEKILHSGAATPKMVGVRRRAPLGRCRRLRRHRFSAFRASWKCLCRKRFFNSSTMPAERRCDAAIVRRAHADERRSTPSVLRRARSSSTIR